MEVDHEGEEEAGSNKNASQVENQEDQKSSKHQNASQEDPDADAGAEVEMEEDHLQYLSINPVHDPVENFKKARFLPSVQKDQILLFGTKNYYYVLRFFITLYERIKLAKNIVGDKLREDLDILKNEKGIDISKYEENFENIKRNRFKKVIGTLFSLVRYQKDVASYEDRLRQLLGMQGYVVFTFEKAVNNIMKAMHTLKSDDLSKECWKLFKKYED